MSYSDETDSMEIQCAEVTFLGNKKNSIVPSYDVFASKDAGSCIRPCHLEDYVKDYCYQVKWFYCTSNGLRCSEEHPHEYRFLPAVIHRLGSTPEDIRDRSGTGPRQRFKPSTSSSQESKSNATNVKKEMLSIKKAHKRAVQSRSQETLKGAMNAVPMKIAKRFHDSDSSDPEPFSREQSPSGCSMTVSDDTPDGLQVGTPSPPRLPAAIQPCSVILSPLMPRYGDAALKASDTPADLPTGAKDTRPSTPHQYSSRYRQSTVNSNVSCGLVASSRSRSDEVTEPDDWPTVQIEDAKEADQLRDEALKTKQRRILAEAQQEAYLSQISERDQVEAQQVEAQCLREARMQQIRAQEGESERLRESQIQREREERTRQEEAARLRELQQQQARAEREEAERLSREAQIQQEREARARQEEAARLRELQQQQARAEREEAERLSREAQIQQEREARARQEEADRVRELQLQQARAEREEADRLSREARVQQEREARARQEEARRVQAAQEAEAERLRLVERQRVRDQEAVRDGRAHQQNPAAQGEPDDMIAAAQDRLAIDGYGRPQRINHRGRPTRGARSRRQLAVSVYDIYHRQDGLYNADRLNFRYRVVGDRIRLSERLDVDIVRWGLINRKNPRTFISSTACIVFTHAELLESALDPTQVRNIVPGHPRPRAIDREKLLLLMSLYHDFVFGEHSITTIKEREPILLKGCEYLSKFLWYYRDQEIKRLDAERDGQNLDEQ